MAIGTTTPHPSAMLDVSSTNRGLLLPRLTEAQRNSIPAPAGGLMIYQTNGTEGIYTFNQSAGSWQSADGGVSPAWDISGNAASQATGIFIGPKNNVEFRFKTNNMYRMGFNTTNGNMKVMPDNWIGVVPVARLSIFTRNKFLIRHTTTALPGTPGPPPVSDAGIRMMWYANKAAFRAGYVSLGFWNEQFVGNYSVAFGENTLATNTAAVAFGRTTAGLGIGSVAGGEGTIASGNGSVSLGRETQAIGEGSVTMGRETIASGRGSVAIGYGTRARSQGEVALGYFNTDYTPVSPAGTSTADRVFSIGNGTGNGSRSNAWVVKKNGYLGIGVDDPLYRLHLPNIASASGRARSTGWLTYSDARVKSSIQPLPYGTATLMQLNPVQYQHHSSQFENGELTTGESSRAIGFIAQQVYEVVPEAVTVPNNEKTDLWAMDYAKILPVLVKAFQEQQEMIARMETQIEMAKQKRNAAKK